MFYCRMKLLVFLAVAKLACTQSGKEDAINNIFSSNVPFSDFLTNYEEVTPPPLKSIGALTKCGEGAQLNRFVCVPYYNCDPNTNTVIQSPDLDGSNKLDIRMGDDDPKCDHYLEVCCQVPDGDGGGNSGGGNNGSTGNGGRERETTPNSITQTTQTGVRNTSSNPVTAPTTGKNQSRRVNCGIRNSQGLDFNLIGGTNEANFGEFPWMLAILRKNPIGSESLSICGGSLIGPRVVLTASHCVQNVSVNEIKVRAGEWDAQTTNERIPYQERNVGQKIMHQYFTRGNLYNDVALLILDRPFTKTDSVGTICLPEENQHFNSRECFATGWGKDIFGVEGRYAVILKKIQMPLVHNPKCQTALRKTRLGQSFTLHRSFICAGGEPNLDTCTGDGGSPLVCPDPNNPSRYVQVGIVAWGIGCGENQVPGVYADVANFRNWIDLRLQELDINTDSYKL